MELPRRAPGDELLKPGELTNLRKRLRVLARKHDLTTVIACAFDHRTRMLPFIFADTRMVPAGVRAIGAAMLDAGFERTRIVLQQWNPRFRPSAMRLDGRLPDLFMVSSMEIHSGACEALIYDACGIDPAHRPLIIAGGPRAVYEPWSLFSADSNNRWAADVVVTGEEYVLLSLLEVLLSMRAGGESLRATFIRARNSGMLDEIPGLVYARTDASDFPQELVNTGVQRLLGDLDELPHVSLGYKMLEPPSRSVALSSQALPASEVRKYNQIASLVLTFGCRFKCPYCPIPAYNQRKLRAKSAERIVDEIRRLHTEYGFRYFFGTDDNFFSDSDRARGILESVARTEIDHVPMRKCIRWGTEVTVHDTWRMREHLPLARMGGIRALWLGVEDMTATFVKKGQSVDRTTEVFRLMTDRGINPMPMMMHHDGQPLYTPGQPYGLLNQVRLLRKSGAITLQVLSVKPAAGSKAYEEAFTSGSVIQRAGNRRLECYMQDGNYVIAAHEERPWHKQLNIMAAYIYFYNPLRLAWSLVRPKSKLYLADALLQIIGMWGLSKTIRRTLGWALALRRGPLQRSTTAPASPLPIVNVGDAATLAASTQPSTSLHPEQTPRQARP